VNFRFALLLFCFLPFNTKASIYDYIYPFLDTPSYSNYGSLGIIQMPNARFHAAGTLGFSWSHNDPYINGSILAYPFSWLEASYQYTDVNNALYSNVSSFSGSQTYKDKGFDFKFRVLKERQLIPQIAFGFRDAAGTGLFSSEYIVASKKIKNFDLTLGLGWGKLNGNRIRNPLGVLNDSFNERPSSIVKGSQGGEFSFKSYFKGAAGYFAGIEYYLPNFKGSRLKVELDGTNYLTEGFPFGRASADLAFEPVKQPDSKLNFGFIYPLSRGVQLKLGYTKGNTISFGFSIKGNLGQKRGLVEKNDPIKRVKNPEVIQAVNSTNELFTYRGSLKFLRDNGLFLQKADINETKLTVSYTQSTFNNHFTSAGRVATILNDVVPQSIKTFEVINMNAGAGMHSIEFDRASFNQYYENQLSKTASKDIQIKPIHLPDLEFKYVPDAKFPVTYWTLKPTLRSQIGGPEGFYFGDIRLSYTNETLFSRKLTLTTAASAGIYDNYDELTLLSDSVLPHVRSDIVKYLKASREFHIKRMQLNYFQSPAKNIYYKLSAGILEEMFSGYGGEIIYRPFFANYAIGAEIWDVRQRDYDMLFSNLDYKIVTGHLNYYYTFPTSQVTFALKGGRFLAGDSGVNFDFSRRFKTGLRIGIFFSRTDISKEEFGEGSFDKGFYFQIPLDVFFQNYSKGLSGFGLRPLTRDGAQYLNHALSLYGVTDQGQFQNIYRDRDGIYD
jgi:hypothetical protein